MFIADIRRCDLNDLFYFAMVVEHGGFSQAGRALAMPKSKLSRRIALLEERLGVRLIQRSTRRFSVTEVGQDVRPTLITQSIDRRALGRTPSWQAFGDLFPAFGGD